MLNRAWPALTAVILLGCHEGPGASAPEPDPCPGAVEQCIDESREAVSLYSEPSLILLEQPGFCGAMISTFRLALAKSTWLTAQSVTRLVNVCYERGHLPYSEFVACQESMLAGDRSIGASIGQYTTFAVQRVQELPTPLALKFNRASVKAMDGELYSEPLPECATPGGEQQTDAPDDAAPVEIPVTTPS